jgi:hypothetical protein
VSSKEQRLKRLLEECRREQEELRSLEAQSGNPSQHVFSAAMTVLERTATMVGKAIERRKAVIDAAKEVAKTHDGLVSTEEVAKLLQQRNVELGVSESRIGTSIGNILYRLPEFRSVGSGLYQYQGEALPLHQH